MHSHGPTPAFRALPAAMSSSSEDSQEFRFMVMTFNIGLQQKQIDTILQMEARSAQNPKEVDKVAKLRRTLSAMLLLLQTYSPDVMVVQEVGGHEEGLRPEDVQHFERFLKTMWTISDGQKLAEDVFAEYEMHANMSYLCWTSRSRVQVLGTRVCDLVQNIPEQRWRVAQVVNALVRPLPTGFGSAHTRPPPPPSARHVRIVNMHLVSGQKDHSSGHNHSLNFRTRLECLANATREAVDESSGFKPRASLVAGDFNIDSDVVLHTQFGHALEERHAWCICDQDSFKDFILSTGASVERTIPLSLWTQADEGRYKVGGHMPIAMTFLWDSVLLPPLPKLTEMPAPLVRRALRLVNEAKKQVRHGNMC